jgi:hypothetical protein
MTRKLRDRLFRKTHRYKAYMEACSITDTDSCRIQNIRGEFIQLRARLTGQMRKPDVDGEKMTVLYTSDQKAL